MKHTFFAEMDESSLALCSGIIPQSYVNQGQQALQSQANMVRILLEKVAFSYFTAFPYWCDARISL